MRLIDKTTKRIAGITNDGMVLWSAGYAVGILVALLSSPLFVVIITLGLAALFGGAKLYSESKHGRRVNVTLPESLINQLPSD